MVDSALLQLRKVLTGLPKLTILNLYLGDNEIGDAGCDSLGEMLLHLTTIKALKLDLRNIRISDAGALTLC